MNLMTSSLPSPNFSKKKYVRLLELLQEHEYQFFSFDEARSSSLADRSIAIRHDIDFSVDYAYTIGKIEADRGVRSNFFFYLASPMVDLFNSKTHSQIWELEKMGHKIGLHVSDFETDPRPLLSFLSGVFPFFETSIVSIHRPGGSLQELQEKRVGNCDINHTYQSRFTRDLFYISDSRGQWNETEKHIFETIESGRSIQLLIHPIWWCTKEGHSAPEKVREAISIHQNELEHRVKKELVSFGI